MNFRCVTKTRADFVIISIIECKSNKRVAMYHVLHKTALSPYAANLIDIELTMELQTSLSNWMLWLLIYRCHLQLAGNTTDFFLCIRFFGFLPKKNKERKNKCLKHKKQTRQVDMRFSLDETEKMNPFFFFL